MVELPGLAVGLLALLGVLVAMGFLAAVRAFTRPVFGGLSSLLRRIPGVGGFLARGVDALESPLVAAMGFAIRHSERFAVAWFHGLEQLADLIGREIEGVALDAYNALRRVVVSTIPRLLRELERRLLRLIRAAEQRVLAAERFVLREAKALERRVLQELRTLRSQLVSLLRATERAILRELRAGLALAERSLRAVEKAVQTVEHRVGELEHQVFRLVWSELRRLAHELDPTVLGPRLLRWVWGEVPGGVRLFLEWAWHWLGEGAEFLIALVRGEWPPPVTHESMREHLLAVQRDSRRIAQSLRDELRGG